MEELAEVFLFLILRLFLSKVRPEGKQTKPVLPNNAGELADKCLHGHKSPTYSTTFHLMTCVTSVTYCMQANTELAIPKNYRELG